MVSPRLAAKARARAAATAMPAAAEAKFCTVSPAIWAKLPSSAFASVELPVGVGDKADGGVESEVRRHSGKFLGIHRQVALKPQDGVEKYERRRAERQQGQGIGKPALTRANANPERGVPGSLQRLEHRVEPGGFPLPDPGHVDAKRPAEDDRKADGQEDLGPSLNVHGLGSLLLELAIRPAQVRTCPDAGARQACRQ